MRRTRRRNEADPHHRIWTEPLRGPFGTVKIHASVAGDLVRAKMSDAHA
jgi:hypothetical protein